MYNRKQDERIKLLKIKTKQTFRLKEIKIELLGKGQQY